MPPISELEDFPAEGLKSSVALLRSKFGGAGNTDNSQIFGASPGRSNITVSRSRTFHVASSKSTTAQQNLVNSSRNCQPQTPENNNTPIKPNTKELINKNQQRRLDFLKGESSPSTEKTTVQRSFSQRAEKCQFARDFLVNNLPSPTSSVSATKSARHLDNIRSSAAANNTPNPGRPGSLVILRRTPPRDSSSSDQVVTHRISITPDQPRTERVPETYTRASPTTNSFGKLGDKPKKSDIEILTSAVKDKGETTFTSEVVLKMASPSLGDKYSHITDIEELNLKLKETREFEERRALRAAIRKLKERIETPSQNGTSSSAVTDVQPSDLPDLSLYTSEEDLKILLHQTAKYEDKKRIRAAIRDLRKKSGERAENASTTSRVEVTQSKTEEPTQSPMSPDTVTVLRDLSNGTSKQVKNLPDLCKNIPATDDSQTTPDEVLVSPIKHESRILHRDDGDVQIETYSKHSRTTSQSDVYEKSTKVTKISKIAGLEISERDEIVTKEKLSVRGSVYTESDMIHKVDIKELDGSKQVIEEDISMEKTSHSKTSGEDTVCNLQLSITKEKSAPKLVKGIQDVTGKDGEPLSLTCEFESLSGDDDKIEVQWLKDGVRVKDGSDIKMSWSYPLATLEIKELLHPDDSGRYTCKARNKQGTVESSATLTVKEAEAKPSLSFSQELSDLPVKDGDPKVTLTCTLSVKDADVEIFWYKNGKTINNTAEFKQSFDGQTAKLVIAEVFPEDSGEYECVAEKGSMEVSTFCKLTVQDNPKIGSLKDEKISSIKMEDTNNNSEKVVVTPENETNGSAVDKCEKILEAATISDEAADSDQCKKSAEEVKETKKVSEPAIKPAEAKTAAFTKPAPKSVSKPGGMNRPGKAAPVSARGAMAAFKQMDTANNPNAASAPRPNSLNSIPAAKHAAKMIKRRAMGIVEIKHEMLTFCKANTTNYENVSIDNFSTSWNNGVAFLALIHHFYPDSFEWHKVDERRRRENFQLAFDLAEKKADIAPLLDVEDMVRMKKPDWKCVFTYVQSFYRKLKDHENNKHAYLQQQ